MLQACHNVLCNSQVQCCIRLTTGQLVGTQLTGALRGDCGSTVSKLMRGNVFGRYAELDSGPGPAHHVHLQIQGPRYVAPRHSTAALHLAQVHRIPLAQSRILTPPESVAASPRQVVPQPQGSASSDPRDILAGRESIFLAPAARYASPSTRQSNP
jgi:hypothetical protein